MSKKKRNKNHVNRIIKASVLTTQVFNLANPYMTATFAAESPNSEIIENADMSDGFSTSVSPLSVASSVYMQAKMEEPPHYTWLSPQESGVSLSANLSMLFSEDVELGAGHLIVHQWGGTEVGRIDVSGGTVAGGTIQISGQSVSMKLDHPLSDNTRYYVEVSSGMFVDRGGQGSNGIWDESTWNFVTADETAPKLVSKLPEDLYLSGVSLGQAYFEMEFNEPVRWDRGYVRLHEASGGAVVRELWISGQGNSNWTASGEKNIASFTLSGGLEEGKPYYVEITSGTLTDMAMNPYGGIHTPQEWTFRTGDMQPYYTDLYPQGSGQRVTPSLTMVFSEEMRLGTGQLTV
ncbi:Ig-like domain-containing protein, partial [Paenibacillus sp. Aloe-11]|uniref:Ig-like domain-containing protein n=1 Tax=Paenibacillus sp. Aloe-11 TaxID=1050222 RepID=UPI00024F01CA